MEGIHIINKEKGPTSHTVVNYLRRITGIRKIGHAGTLDPLASGVLIVGIGRAATRQLEHIVKFEKEYLATIKLGESSTTDDAEGAKTPYPLVTPPNKKAVVEALKAMTGEYQQMPPIFSALKIKGQTAYKLARAGKTPELKPRKVFIKNIEVKKYDWPEVKIKVVCGPGTYIRSIARDLGQALGTGGYITELVRTRVGSHRLKDAVTLDKFEKQFQKQKTADKLVIS